MFGHDWIRLTRTRTGQTFRLTPRPDLPPPRRGTYRNPVIFAGELQTEMLRYKLTRKQLAARHGITSDRISHWLCLLKLPEGKLKEMEALGDHWEKSVVTARELRTHRPLDKEARTAILLKHQIRYEKVSSY